MEKLMRLEDAQSAVVAYKEGKMSLEEAARIFSPMLIHISRDTAYKRNVNADDLAQNLFIALSTNAFKSYDVRRKFSAYLRGVADNIAMHMYRERKNELTESEMITLTRDDDFNIEDLGEAPSDQIPIEEEIDRKRAIQTLERKRMLRLKEYGEKAMDGEAGRLSGTGPLSDSLDSPVKVPKVKVKKKTPDILDENAGNRENKIGEDHKELRAIRKSLNMSRDHFAKSIGINKWLLDSYEYGRTWKVPQHTMEKARLFYENSVGTDKDLVELLSGMEMSEILNRWCSHIGIEATKLSETGRALGVNAVTVKRWSENKARPMMNKLVAMDKDVFSDPISLRLGVLQRSLDRIITEVGVGEKTVFSASSFDQLNVAIEEFLSVIPSQNPSYKGLLYHVIAQKATMKKITYDDQYFYVSDDLSFKNTLETILATLKTEKI